MSDCQIGTLLAAPLIDVRDAETSPLPLNVMAMPGVPARARLAELGVARISHGPGPYRGAMQWLADAARAAMALTRRRGPVQGRLMADAMRTRIGRTPISIGTESWQPSASA